MNDEYQPQTPRKSPTLLSSMESPADNRSGGDQPRLVASYAHLPTPQSPNNLASYVPGPTNPPESPMSLISHSSRSLGEPLVQLAGSGTSVSQRSPLRSQQIMTPEASPHTGRYENSSLLSTPTPRTSGNMDLLTSISSLTPPRKTPSPSQNSSASRLSSPFVAKSSASQAKSSRPSSASPPTTITMPSATPTTPVSPHPLSSDLSAPINPVPIANGGGELDRIHHAIQQQQDAVENRRPDYLKRSKRSPFDGDLSMGGEDLSENPAGFPTSIGIMESPMKGRRIQLFQETSEESFEESLMAGGYGRYRTAEWVRQPQPIVVASSTGAPVNVVAHLEETQHQEPPPPTEKELRKRKRLDAFRSSTASTNTTSSHDSTSRLYPVEIEGKGRVLLDVPTEPIEFNETASKKRGTPGKRKKRAEPTAKERRAAAALAALEASAERPNWPDAEFPWKLRTEERAEQAKAEEEERLGWIERFLDRDTDDEEDGGDMESIGGVPADNGDEEVLPSSVWGVVYDEADERPVPYRAGRGKMVPLRGDPDHDLDDREYRGFSQYYHQQRRRVLKRRRRSAYFPSDPADARAALLSKRSVRALSFRRQLSRSTRGQKRRRTGSFVDDSDDEIVCICHGTDDGRELVQCDSCDNWYHLECIGIEDVSELGPEEAEWFCFRCDDDLRHRMETRSDDSFIEASALVVPDFAPTDDTPIRQRLGQADPTAQFFIPPSVPESPTQSWSLSRVPKTPTRPAPQSQHNPLVFGSGYSRNAPVTPHRERHQHSRDAHTRVIAGPFGDAFGSDDTRFDPTSTPSRSRDFDPTSTPSRGIVKAAGPFTTPKTPSRAKTDVRGSGGSFGAAGFLSSALSERGGAGPGHVVDHERDQEPDHDPNSSPYTPYTRSQQQHSHPTMPYEEFEHSYGSPIRRAYDGQRAGGVRRIGFVDPPESPLASRTSTKGKGRALDFGVENAMG